MTNLRKPIPVNSMLFAGHPEIDGSDRSHSETAFEYWKKICALSQQLDPLRIPFAKGDALVGVVDLDDLTAAMLGEAIPADAFFLASLRASPDDLTTLNDEMGALYQLSVNRWTHNMEKIRISSP